jgi:hypothetical protein
MTRAGWTLALALACAAQAAAQEFSKDGISFSVPDKEKFKIKTSDFEDAWPGTIAQIVNEEDLILGCLAITEEKHAAKDFAKSRIDGWKQDADIGKTLKVLKNAAKGSAHVLEYTFEYADYTWHYIEVIHGGDRVVELALWCPEDNWKANEAAMRKISESVKAGGEKASTTTSGSTGGGSAVKASVPENLWKDFGVGTKIVYRMVNEMSGMKMEGTITQELVAKDDKSFRVKVTTEMQNLPKTEAEMEYVVDPNAGSGGGGGGVKADVQKGKETIKVEAGEFECEWIETKVQGSTTRVWQSKKVPGGMVKTAGETSAGKMTMELVKFEAK